MVRSNHHVTPRDIAFYHEQGYLVVPEVLDPPTLQELRGELPPCSRGGARSPRTPICTISSRATAPTTRACAGSRRRTSFSAFQRLVRHPRMVAIVQALVGRAVRLHGSKINLKAPRYG